MRILLVSVLFKVRQILTIEFYLVNTNFRNCGVWLNLDGCTILLEMVVSYFISTMNISYEGKY